MGVNPSGSWIDVTPLPTGGVAIATLNGSTLVVEELTLDGGDGRWLWGKPLRNDDDPLGATNLIYLRAAADGQGRVCVVGQGTEGDAWICRDAGPWESLGPTFGVFCVEVAGEPEGGWTLAILRPGFYELFDLPVAGPPRLVSQHPTPTTQGFIQIDDRVVLQDDGRTAIPGLILGELGGGYAAGQNPDDGPNRVRLTDGVRFAALIESYAQPPHCVVAKDGSVWVCSWVAEGAWVEGYAPTTIPWGNEEDVPPEPPDPEPPDPPEPEDEMKPPRVTITHYDKTLSPDTDWRVLVEDSGNPGVTVTVELLSGDLHVALGNPAGSDRSGASRMVEITGGEVEPPDPPDPPDPEPPEPEPEPPGPVVEVITGFVCVDGTHYLCAYMGVNDGDGEIRLVADRTAEGEYERFTLEPQADGATAIRANVNQAYLRAAEGGGKGVYADRMSVGADERFVLLPCDAYPNAWSIRTRSGLFLAARGGGGGEVVADGLLPDAASGQDLDGLFTATASIAPEFGAGGSLTGRVVWTPQGLRDDTGLFLPKFMHFGDAALRWDQDRGDPQHIFDVSGPYVHGYRVWCGRLLPSFWDDYILSEGSFASFQAELKARGLRLMWDGGDLGRASREERDRVQRILLDVGDRDVLASVSCCNEGNDNSDMEPGEMADWVAPIIEKWPDLAVWCTTGGAGHEMTNHLRDEGIDGYDDHQNMDRWNPGQKVVGKHGYRDGTVVDKSRHCFSFVYEGCPEAPWVVDDEPCGPGSFVSVTENQQQLDPAGICTIYLTATISKNWWVFFPGVEKKTQPIEQFLPHLQRISEQHAQLPADLWSWPTLIHGGRGEAIWKVTDGGQQETARCDQALSSDGRYVSSNYDEPPRQSFTQAGGIEESRIDNAPWGFVSIGRV